MIKGVLALPWFLWAGLALIIAVIYTFVWPQQTVTETAGFRFLLVRWGHALAWLLLTVNFVLRGISSSFDVPANLVALAGGLIYLLFLFGTFVVK